MISRVKLASNTLLLVIFLVIACASLAACDNDNYIDKNIKDNKDDVTIIVMEEGLPKLPAFLGVNIIRNELPDSLTTQTNIVVAAAEWFTNERITTIKTHGYSFIIYGNESNEIRHIATTYGATPSYFTNIAATLNGAIIYTNEGQEGCEYLASVDMEKINENQKFINTIKIGIYFSLNNFEFIPE